MTLFFDESHYLIYFAFKVISKYWIKKKKENSLLFRVRSLTYILLKNYPLNKRMSNI